MVVCNIFDQDILTNNGSFLTFSQYLEDMTKHNTMAASYKVVPSKYVAMELDFASKDNGDVPTDFQNYFENACTRFKNVGGVNWTPEYSKHLFWQMLIDREYIGAVDREVPEIKYVGDINIHSYDLVDGVGYSEIYCHIPNDAQRTLYKAAVTEGATLQAGNYIEGYNSTTAPGVGGVLASAGGVPPTYQLNEYDFAWETTKSASLGQSISTDTSFNVDSIVILYDIYTNDELVYEGIPMGIYFTGTIADSTMSNSITKYVSNDSAYGSGTSFGLRICSRYITTGDSLAVSTNVDSNCNSELTQVLSQIAISQNKMDEILDKAHISNQNYKDLLAIFKNSKTNVPYIKNINGVNYWFVNGKMLNRASYNEGEDNHECIDLQVSIANNVWDLSEGTSTTTINKEIDWVVKSGDITLHPSKLYLYDGTTTDYVEKDTSLNPLPVSISKPSSSETKAYSVKVEIGGEEIVEDACMYFRYPCYYKVTSTPSSCLSGSPSKILDQNGNIPVNKKFRFTYSNNSTSALSNHICIAYPSEYGELTSIIGSDGQDYIQSFIKTTGTKTFGSKSVSYNIYYDANRARVTNFSFKIR